MAMAELVAPAQPVCILTEELAEAALLSMLLEQEEGPAQGLLPLEETAQAPVRLQAALAAPPHLAAALAEKAAIWERETRWPELLLVVAVAAATPQTTAQKTAPTEE